MNFDTAFERVVGNEGGFQNRASDWGNWTGGAPGQGQLKGTKYGVSAKAYPDLDIENLTLEGAKAIYRRDYWRDDLPNLLLYPFFDAAVNHGKAEAAIFLQRAVGVPADGDIGPATRAAVAKFDQYDLAIRFMAERFDFWAQCWTWPADGKGWTRRGAHVLRELVEDHHGP